MGWPRPQEAALHFLESERCLPIRAVIILRLSPPHPNPPDSIIKGQDRDPVASSPTPDRQVDDSRLALLSDLC